jgi:hypothetical protein
MYGDMLMREVVQFTTSTIPYTQIYGSKRKEHGTFCCDAAANRRTAYLIEESTLYGQPKIKYQNSDNYLL